MRFKKFAFILSIIISLMMFSGCFANGHLDFYIKKPSGSSGSGGGENGTIFVDLHSIMPSTNERPTVDNPNPTNASRNIARAFSARTGVAVSWASEYDKPTSGLEGMRSWYNKQISVNNCPIIGYTGGTSFQEMGWYLDLTEYLERPNPYVEGNEHWKDLFYDWVWDDHSVKDAKGRIVALPLLLHAGTATAIYYNKNLVSSEAANWQQFLNTQYELESKVQFPYIPYTGELTIGLYTWPIRFSISPGYLKTLIDLPLSQGGVDYDGDGKLSTNESVRAVLENRFNPNNSTIVKEFYRNALTYYKSLRPGWNSTSADTYLNAWRGGNAGMVNQGIWFWNTEKQATHKFDYSLFPTPVMMKDETNSPNASNLERKTLDEGFESGVAMAFNIMKNGITSESQLEKAIDFLMYLTTPAANQQLAEENGVGFPVIKDSAIGSIFVESGWTTRKFTNIYDGEWPFGFISTNITQLDDAFGEWYRGNINDSQFFTYVNQYLKDGAMKIVDQMGIEHGDWDY